MRQGLTAKRLEGLGEQTMRPAGVSWEQWGPSEAFIEERRAWASFVGWKHRGEATG